MFEWNLYVCNLKAEKHEGLNFCSWWNQGQDLCDVLENNDNKYSQASERRDRDVI